MNTKVCFEVSITKEISAKEHCQEKKEHRTSNVQHRIKNKQQIPNIQLRLGVVSFQQF
jgi:two-component sensor histidine kinase